MKKFFILIFSLLFIYICIGFYLTYSFEKQTLKNTEKNNIELNKFLVNKSDEIHKIKIDNKDFKYHYFKNKNSKETVILTHGVTSNINSISNIANALYQQNKNIIIFNSRLHGDNKEIGKVPSFGKFEAEDLHKLITNYHKIYPNKKIYLYGVSMGASAVITYAKKYDYNNIVSKYVAESSYNSMASQVNQESKKIIPIGINLFYPILNIIFSIKYDFNFNDNIIIDNLDNIKHKILFITPNKDPRIDPNISKKFYDLTKKNKNSSLVMFQCNKHAKSWMCQDHNIWRNEIVNFFN